jgi:hypothetical protein
MNTQTMQLIATDINEITLLVARAVKGLTANGHPIRAVAIHQAARQQWSASIAYTERPAASSARRTHQSPTTNHQPPSSAATAADGTYIKLVDLAERCYYSLDAARHLCVELNITLHRGNGTGRPHYVTHADAIRFAEEQCPGVRIDFNGVLHQSITLSQIAA